MEHMKSHVKPPQVLCGQRWKDWSRTKHIPFESRGFIYNDTQDLAKAKKPNLPSHLSARAVLYKQTRKTPWGRKGTLSCDGSKSQTRSVLPSNEQGGQGPLCWQLHAHLLCPLGKSPGTASGFHLAHGLHEAGTVGDCCRQENKPVP